MSASAAKLATLYQGFTNQFTNVKSVTAAQLHTELQDPDGKKITLIDVRTPEEQRVSRLPGSVLSKDAFEERSSSIAKSAPLVTYWYGFCLLFMCSTCTNMPPQNAWSDAGSVCCSTAGLRSGRYAEQLIAKGFTDVRNLEGSILAWVSKASRKQLASQSQPPSTLHSCLLHCNAAQSRSWRLLRTTD